jgi:hypothetical protein
MHPRL